MQPNLLTPEKEETSSQPLLTPEPAPCAPAPANEPTNVQPFPAVEKKHSRLNIAAIVLGTLVFLLLIGGAGLGYAAYILRAELISTQQQLSTLHGEHDKLEGDYTALTSDSAKINAELAQTKADLEKANADLTTAQGDLKKSQDENKQLNARMDRASKLSKILYAWFTTKNPSDVFKIDSQIKDAKDAKLTALWNKLTNSPSEDKFGELIIYLVSTIHDQLK
jgi:hypothetical protein